MIMSNKIYIAIYIIIIIMNSYILNDEEKINYFMAKYDQEKITHIIRTSI